MKYIFPPRPETKIAPKSLPIFEKMGKFLAEPKLNGSSMQIYFSASGKEMKLMNRHKQPITCKMNKEELRKLYRGTKEMILCGEYMNKNCKDETGKPWNHKYVIWDIIMYDGEHLMNTTFECRQYILLSMYSLNYVKHFLHQISENCFRVDFFKKGFLAAYQGITKYDMYEGLVLKRIDGKLENGTTEKNNTRTQIKCRRSTKNYLF